MVLIHTVPSLFRQLEASCLIALLVLPVMLAAVDTEELEGFLVQAVIDAMHAAHLTHKDLAFYMQIDEKQLRRQLNREKHQHLALVKVFRLPFAWWAFFGPSLIALVARKRFQEIAADAKSLVRRDVA